MGNLLKFAGLTGLIFFNQAEAATRMGRVVLREAFAPRMTHRCLSQMAPFSSSHVPLTQAIHKVFVLKEPPSSLTANTDTPQTSPLREMIAAHALEAGAGPMLHLLSDLGSQIGDAHLYRWHLKNKEEMRAHRFLRERVKRGDPWALKRSWNTSYSLPWLQNKADQGDPWALEKLFQIYMTGKGLATPGDFFKAERLLMDQLAKVSFPPTRLSNAFSLAFHDGVQEDLPQRLSRQYTLFTLENFLPPHDWVRASLLSKAPRGNPWAIQVHVQGYRDGKYGFPKDLREARVWNERLLDKDPLSRAVHYNLWEDPASAQAWLKRCYQQGELWAIREQFFQLHPRSPKLAWETLLDLNHASTRHVFEVASYLMEGKIDEALRQVKYLKVEI